MSILKKLILETLASKKFLATVIGVLVSTAGKSLGLPEETIIQIVASISAYVIGQGIADNGKAAAKIKAGS